MNQKLKRMMLGLFLATFVSSCNDNEPNLTENTTSTDNKAVAIELGEKLENPYSVVNMKKALANLRKSRPEAKMATDDFEVTTTHLYVKFTPKNEAELDALKADSTLVLYDYPLDYKIEVNGDYYRDPTIPADQPTPKYAAIKVNKVLPKGYAKTSSNVKVMENVEQTILEELYIPDEDFDTDTNNSGVAAKKINGKTVSVALVDALVDEALRITNNLDNTSPQNKNAKIARQSKWRPAGRIRVWDDALNDYIGVEGAQVRARRWFTTHSGWVDSNGFYSCDGEFRRDANYSIDWDRNGTFHIQDGWLNGATYNGPKQEGNWDLKLRDDKQAYYATIFSGAYFFYYKNILGLSRPPEGLRIKARLEKDESSHVKIREGFFGAAISLMAWGNKSQTVFSTTIHELAHAQHRSIDTGSYSNVVFDAYTSPCASPGEGCDNPGPTGKNNRRLMETWAQTVEIVLTLERYRNVLNRPDFVFSGENLQIKPIAFSGSNNYYTSAGFDMIDDLNQRTHPGFTNRDLLPIDRVSGYNILQLQGALIGAKSWWQWRDNIKNRYDNPTEENLDELFNNWNE